MDWICIASIVAAAYVVDLTIAGAMVFLYSFRSRQRLGDGLPSKFNGTRSS